jgi:hypothetical protein
MALSMNTPPVGETELHGQSSVAPILAPALAPSAGNEISSAVNESLLTLQAWVERHDYAGYEPFDILNAPLLRGQWARSWPLAIAFMQFGKRYAGLGLRRGLRVPQSKNPKALGLFINAYCDLARCGEDTQSAAAYLKSELKRLRSPHEAEYCWGYDWDHVSRAGRMPAFSANCIATCFCANALLDMAEVFSDVEARAMAQSAGRFLVTRLNRPVDTPHHLCFSYTPNAHMRVFNASVIAGALLARLAPENPEYSQLARRTMNYLVACQQPNGSWYYGASLVHRWIDGFHSAYNVEALYTYQRCTGDASFKDAMRLGYEYYVSTFFRADGAPKYFHNSVYPIDIHSCSQAILTFCDFAELDPSARERALGVTDWTLRQMRNGDGTFSFQKHRFWTNRAPYMRWGQAWMLHALARLKRQYLYPHAEPDLKAHTSKARTVWVKPRKSC